MIALEESDDAAIDAWRDEMRHVLGAALGEIVECDECSAPCDRDEGSSTRDDRCLCVTCAPALRGVRLDAHRRVEP